MSLRRTERKKDGKTHSYRNIVENKRLDDGRVVQRHVLYLGEINSSQAVAWRKAIEAFDEDGGRPRTLALFLLEGLPAVLLGIVCLFYLAEDRRARLPYLEFDGHHDSFLRVMAELAFCQGCSRLADSRRSITQFFSSPP